MAKKKSAGKVTSMDTSEQNTMSRLGSQLPKGLDRQDNKAKVPAGASADKPPTPAKPRQAVSEEYYTKTGASGVHNPTSNRGATTRG